MVASRTSYSPDDAEDIGRDDRQEYREAREYGQKDHVVPVQVGDECDVKQSVE